MLRGVADTNVLVAALVGRGSPRQLLDAAFEGLWRPVVSPLLLAELEDVLGRKKFSRITPDEAHQFVADVRSRAEVVPDAPAPWLVETRDPKDDYLVALARAAGVDALVSGDVHLTELVDLVPAVMTPAAFLARIADRHAK